MRNDIDTIEDEDGNIVDMSVHLFGRRATVYSPDADELVTGTVYHETATQICIETPKGRIVGGPKRLLLGHT
jgi:hypothetical protein